VAQTARRTCDSLAASLTGNNAIVTTVDLPNVLRGVYFSNGMAECVELLHGIDPERVRRNNTGVMVLWDAQSETLKR
jgi:hypothetical protein